MYNCGVPEVACISRCGELDSFGGGTVHDIVILVSALTGVNKIHGPMFEGVFFLRENRSYNRMNSSKRQHNTNYICFSHLCF